MVNRTVVRQKAILMTESNQSISKHRPVVDKGLIKMFLKLTPEERIQANDNAIRTFSELNNAFKQQKTAIRKSGRHSNRP